MERRVVKPPGQDMVVERLKSRYGLAGRCSLEVRWVEATVGSAGRLREVASPAFLRAAHQRAPALGENRLDGRGVALVLVTNAGGDRRAADTEDPVVPSGKHLTPK